MALNLAQTNLQLREQLFEKDHTIEFISTIDGDYAFSTQFFGDRFRSTGRPFVCHLIGTASCLDFENASEIEIRTGFLHAIYTHGRFPDGSSGSSKRNRKLIANKLGAELEEMIYNYNCFKFKQTTVPGLLSELPIIDSSEYSILKMRICNEVDDCANNGALLGGKKRYNDDNWLKMVAEIAQKMQLVFCKNALEKAIDSKDQTSNANFETHTAYPTNMPKIINYLQKKLGY